MAVQARTRDVTATVTLWVPLDASGDLTSGVEGVLDGVDRVESTDVYDISDVQPRSTDIRVTAIVGVSVATSDDSADDVLADGFGVMDVDRVRAERSA